MSTRLEDTRHLKTLLKLSQTLNSSLDLTEVLDTAIRQVVDFVGAERGFILVVEENGKRVIGKATHGIDPVELELSLTERDPLNRAQVSRTIAKHVLTERIPVLSRDALSDPRFGAHTSVRLSQVRAVVCVPMMLQDRLLGLVYLDSRVSESVFDYGHVDMLTAFANQASVAVENARLYTRLERSLEERLRLQQEVHRTETERLELEATFGRNVSRQVMQYLMKSPENRLPGGTVSEATVLFMDIRDFTAYAASAVPQQVVAELNELFAEVTPVAGEHGGLVYRYTGDGLMAVFGVPYPVAGHAKAALDTAREMVRRVELINSRRLEKGLPAWTIGCGIHTGRVVAGNVGTAERSEFTVIGDPVNVAARLQELTKTLCGQIVVSAETCVRAEAGSECGPPTRILIRGKEEPMSVYVIDLLGLPPD